LILWHFFLTSDIILLEDQDPSEFAVRVIEIPFVSLPKPIKILQDAREGCGGHLWNAAFHLCDYIERELLPKGLLKNKRIIELGAGTGLVGMFVLLQPSNALVSLTDLNVMVPVMNSNVKENITDIDVLRRLQVAELRWGEYCSAFKYWSNGENKVETGIDFILLSDCVYLEVCFEPLIKTLIELSSPYTIILMSYQHRRKAENRFFKLLNKQFTCEKISKKILSEKYHSTPVQVFKIQKKNNIININGKQDIIHTEKGKEKTDIS